MANYDSPVGGVCSGNYTFPTEPQYYHGHKGYYNVDFFINIIKEAPSFFWAYQFWFVEGNGGYVGLQTNGSIAGKEQKIAIFSIWDALDGKAGTNGVAKPFGGEGEGYSCKIPFDWKENTKYRLRIWEITDAAKPDEDEWWGAWVMNMTTNEETFIGQIKVPGSWDWMKNTPACFVEGFGQQDGVSRPCNEVPNSKALFISPEMENGTISANSLTFQTYGKCKENGEDIAKVYVDPNDPLSFYAEVGREV